MFGDVGSGTATEVGALFNGCCTVLPRDLPPPYRMPRDLREFDKPGRLAPGVPLAWHPGIQLPRLLQPDPSGRL